jgi:hypothetical protein
MPDYRLTICRSASKELENLNTTIIARIFPINNKMTNNGLPS